MSMMLKNLSDKCLAAAAAAAVASILGGCWTTPEPAPINLKLMQQSEQNAAREVSPLPMRPLPTTLQSQFISSGTVERETPAAAQPTTAPAGENQVIVRMPLEEIIHRAVANNLDVKVAGYQPAIDETRVTEAEAKFDPSFFQNLQYQYQDQTNGFGFPNENSRNITSQTGVRQTGPSGGQFEVRYEGGYFEPQNSINHVKAAHPFFNNAAVMQVTQPLLRNFGNEVNRAQIVVNRNNQRISLLEFRKQLEQSVSDIEKAYWALVAAEQELQIDEQLLNVTIDTGEILFKRRGQDVTRVQLAQANSSIESRRAVLVRARAHVKDLSDQLKELMNDADLPVTSAVVILPPPDAALQVPVHFDLKDQIDTALANRFELGEQQLRINNADTVLQVAKNGLQPRLDALGTVSFQGLEPHLDGTIRDQTGGRYLTYSFGFQFEVPIGNREARAQYARSELQRQQALLSYANEIDKVSLDVTQAWREVQTAWDEIVATKQATFAAQDALLAINQREQGGEPLTPTFVQLKLDTQQTLATAKTNEVEAISRYNNDIAALEQVKGTLLRYNNVVMEEVNMPVGYRPSRQ